MTRLLMAVLAVLVGAMVLGGCSAATPRRWHPNEALAERQTMQIGAINRRAAYIDAQRPPPGPARRIRRGRLLVGMTRDEVKASIGLPERIRTDIHPRAPTAEEWTYRISNGDRYRLHFRDGILIYSARKGGFE